MPSPKNGKGSRPCPVCGRVALNSSYLLAHMSKHSTEVFECLIPDCNSAFKYASNLRKHMRIVHGGQFSCYPCRLRFKRRREMQEHWRRIHSNEQRYLRRATPKNTSDISLLD